MATSSRAGDGFAQQDIGFLHIAVSATMAQSSARLPWHHTDPFDRLLIAQALDLGLQLVTRDAAFGAYGIAIVDA